MGAGCLVLVFSCLLQPAHSLNWATSALRTHRLDSNYHSGIMWNAGAIRDDRLGWISVATENNCFNDWTNEYRDATHCDNTKMGPWVSFMGRGRLPALTEFISNGSRWEYDTSSIQPFILSGDNPYYVVEDARIFLWKGVPHISAVFRGIGYVVRRDQDRGSYQSIFRMEQTSRTFKLLKIFSNPANGAQGPPEVQKNWGFFEHQKSLLILYSVFPCATIYRVLNDDNFHFELVSKVCYKDRDSMLADNIMLEIERSHNSAHPIVWNHDGRKEILMMVHTHTTHIIGGYNHWLVRFSFDTFEITHVSYGIVFGTAMFHSEGPEALGGKIIIAGTITITSDESGDHLHIFGGEGDSHCIYHTVPLSSIFWLPIGDATSVVSRINIDDVNSGGEVGTHQRKKDGSTQN